MSPTSAAGQEKQMNGGGIWAFSITKMFDLIVSRRSEQERCSVRIHQFLRKNSRTSSFRHLMEDFQPFFSSFHVFMEKVLLMASVGFLQTFPLLLETSVILYWLKQKNVTFRPLEIRRFPDVI